MFMSLLTSLGRHCMKLDNLRVSLSTCIQGNPFQIHSTYFPLDNCFYKSRHGKESILKRISKGKHAITSMKSVKVFIWTLLLFSRLPQKNHFYILVANKNGITKKHLMQKMSCLSDEPRKVLLGTLGSTMVMQYTSKFQGECKYPKMM
jgi:hypothetical protein